VTGERRLLIVDDDEDILEVSRIVLEEAGYDVATAHHGGEALEQLHAPGGESISLILLDLMMPVMDGWELRRRLLADPTLRDIPVVVCSGDRLELATVPSEIAAVLVKPVGLDALLDTVGAHCA
jgi:CheY-like chemotaxis protein